MARDRLSDEQVNLSGYGTISECLDKIRADDFPLPDKSKIYEFHENNRNRNSQIDIADNSFSWDRSVFGAETHRFDCYSSAFSSLFLAGK